MFKDGILYYPSNVPLTFPENENIVDFVLDQISKHCKEGRGENRWITNPDTKEFCTISQVEPRSRKVASSLYKRGLRKGDVVVYSAHDPVRLYTFFMGVWRANGIVRACYPEESIAAITERIKESNVKWFLCDPCSANNVKAAVENVPWDVEIIVFGQEEGCTHIDEIFNDDGESCPPLDVTPNDTALILATSGTTGTCKGAVHTHSGVTKILATLNHGAYEEENQEGKLVNLVMGKPTHMSGFSLPFSALLGGRHILMLSKITKESIFQTVHNYKPMTVFGFPKFLLYLANDKDAHKYDVSSVRYFITGGVVITPSFIKTMETLPGVQVMTGYGLTESALLVHTRNADPKTLHDFRVLKNVPDFSVGKLVPGALLQVRDIETGEVLGRNQQGELFFKSPITCAGYLNRPEETAKAFSDGWLRTGDVGYFDDDDFIFVVDRCKEIFKYYNDHISPSELENVISRHEAVDSVCVVGIPDPEGGDTIPRAFVTLKDSTVTAEKIKAYTDEIVAPYKRLRGGLFVLPELPVGKTGKVDRMVLSKMQV